MPGLLAAKYRPNALTPRGCTRVARTFDSSHVAPDGSIRPAEWTGGRVHILLVEDDERISGFIARALREEGHVVDVAADGKTGLTRAASESYDVIVLDRMLPLLDGLKVLQALRAMDDHTPVLILSALGGSAERVRGLRAGGDDDLAKPFALDELVARVEVLGRRRSQLALPARLAFGDVVIDPVARVVSRGGQRIELTHRAVRSLPSRARHPRRGGARRALLRPRRP